MLTYRCLHNTALSYLAESLQLAADVEARQHLCSTDSMKLVVPATHCSTLGDQVFPVSAARTWNALPSAVRAAPSLASFWQKLIHTLFSHHFLTALSSPRPVCLYSALVTVNQSINLFAKCRLPVRQKSIELAARNNYNCDSVTLIYALIIIIIIIIIISGKWPPAAWCVISWPWLCVQWLF